MSVIALISGFIGLKPVQWALLGLVAVLLAASIYLKVVNAWLSADLKSAKGDLAWVQGALNLQNESVRNQGVQLDLMKKQQEAKAVQAAKVVADTEIKVKQIMTTKMSSDCKEVAAWGVEQSITQSQWQ